MIALLATWSCSTSSLNLNLPPSRSGVRVLVQERFYDVTGLTAAEIQRSKRDNGPRRTDGRNFAGYTTWRIRWTYATRQLGTACTLSDIRVTLEMTVEMPRWVDRSAASAPLTAAWDQYYEALRKHEEGHAHRNVEAANRVKNTLDGMQASCIAVRDLATHDAQRVLDALRRGNRDYDDETSHGATEGAVWPPSDSSGRRVSTPAPRDSSWIVLQPGSRVRREGFAVFRTGRDIYVRRTVDAVSRLVMETAASVTIQLSPDLQRVVLNEHVGELERHVVSVDLDSGMQLRLDTIVSQRFHDDVELDSRLHVAPRAIGFSPDGERVLVGMLLVHVEVASMDEAIRLGNAYERRWYVVEALSGRILDVHVGRRRPTTW